VNLALGVGSGSNLLFCPDIFTALMNVINYLDAFKGHWT
jgi:hypothetical protein